MDLLINDFRVRLRSWDDSRAAPPPFTQRTGAPLRFYSEAGGPASFSWCGKDTSRSPGPRPGVDSDGARLLSRLRIRVEGLMVRSAITSLVCLAALMSGCAATATRGSGPEGTSPPADVQLLTIELRDHPDPHTGALRVIDGARAWPLELGALLDAVSHDWAPASVYDVRRATLAGGVVEQTEETTVRVLESNRNTARLSVKLDAATQPIEVTVPINSTVVVGSESGGQRHAFVALSVLDRATRMRIPEVFSTREPGIAPPLQLDHSSLAAPESARANGQKGVVLAVEIDERGNVIRVHVLGRRFLTDTDIASIEKTVSEWKFKPGTANGKAVRVVTTVTSLFSGL
jgi:hypothetical protein